jgi:hypothetical protein
MPGRRNAGHPIPVRLQHDGSLFPGASGSGGGTLGLAVRGRSRGVGEEVAGGGGNDRTDF